MTREQIEKAALLCAGAGEYGECPYNPDAKKGFIAGAEWRINSVWHNDLKKRKIQKPILVRFKNGLFMVFEDIRELKGIENEVKIFAYLEDLIPNSEDCV